MGWFAVVRAKPPAVFGLGITPELKYRTELGSNKDAGMVLFGNGDQGISPRAVNLALNAGSPTLGTRSLVPEAKAGAT